MPFFLTFFISLAFGFMALFALRRNGGGRRIALLFAVLLFLNLFVWIAYLVSDYFTSNGIDESVLFHLQYGLSGAGYGEYTNVILTAFLFLHIAINISFAAYFYVSSSVQCHKRESISYAVFFLVCAYFFNPGLKNLLDLHFLDHEFFHSEDALLAFPSPGFDQPKSSAQFRPGEGQPDINGHEIGLVREFAANVRPMNIVYIYLEGLEQTYLDESLFPGLVPRLIQLQRQGIHFTDIREVYGTGWTIAGMVASQCGIPLVSASDRNSMSGMDQFLPGALCLGDLLDEHGYELTFLGGAPLDFAGKGKFHVTHGFSQVYGLHEITGLLDAGQGVMPPVFDDAHEQLTSGKSRQDGRWPTRWLQDMFASFFPGRFARSGHVHAWGIFDDVLFDFALEKFLELAAKDRPFGLFLLTLDTHHPSGHLSPSCAGRPYGNGDNPMLNAVHCADTIVSGFIENIMQSEHAGQTMIIVSSDHLALRNTASDQLEKGQRRNLFFVLHPGMRGGLGIHRPGAMLDVGPTLLSLMGFDAPRLGFGRDLLGEEPTLIETHEHADAFLRSQRNHLTKLWEFPQLDRGVRIDAVRRKMELGERSINIPALLALDEELNVVEIYFEFWSDIKLLDYLLGFEPGQGWIWADSCRNIAAVAPDQAFPENEQICVAKGRLGSEFIPAHHVRHTRQFSREDVESSLRASTNSSLNAQRRLRIRNLRHFEVYDLEELPAAYVNEASMDGRLVVTSSGGFRNGQSNIFSMSAEQESSLSLERGLHLIGVRSDAQAVNLAHIDSCLPDSLDWSQNHPGLFAERIEREQNSFAFFIVMAHDSGNCDKDFDLKNVFQGLPLKKWDRIGHRQPYIGITSADASFHESVGGYEELLRLSVK